MIKNFQKKMFLFILILFISLIPFLKNFFITSSYLPFKISKKFSKNPADSLKIDNVSYEEILSHSIKSGVPGAFLIDGKITDFKEERNKEDEEYLKNYFSYKNINFSLIDPLEFKKNKSKIKHVKSDFFIKNSFFYF